MFKNSCLAALQKSTPRLRHLSFRFCLYKDVFLVQGESWSPVKTQCQLHPFLLLLSDLKSSKSADLSLLFPLSLLYLSHVPCGVYACEYLPLNVLLFLTVPCLAFFILISMVFYSHVLEICLLGYFK